uniref:Plasmid stabilization system n=1 Tax=uncultured Desulfobacterium sp. TaxID=201089 RepID=E1YJV6_9BACT|nr:hypothetical protein N47_E50720 [uncultured Desulfobacterium sp.]
MSGITRTSKKAWDIAFASLLNLLQKRSLRHHFMYRILKAPFRRHLLPKFPYSIIYAIEPDHIRIIAVAHSKRKPGYWSARIPDNDENCKE